MPEALEEDLGAFLVVEVFHEARDREVGPYLDHIHAHHLGEYKLHSTRYSSNCILHM